MQVRRSHYRSSHPIMLRFKEIILKYSVLATWKEAAEQLNINDEDRLKERNWQGGRMYEMLTGNMKKSTDQYGCNGPLHGVSEEDRKYLREACPTEKEFDDNMAKCGWIWQGKWGEKSKTGRKSKAWTVPETSAPNFMKKRNVFRYGPDNKVTLFIKKAPGQEPAYGPAFPEDFESTYLEKA